MGGEETVFYRSTYFAVIVLCVATAILTGTYFFLSGEREILFSALQQEPILNITFDSEPPIDNSNFAHPISALGAPQFANGKAVLDGINDYLEIPSHDAFNTGDTNEMSFAMKIKSDNYAQRQVIISRAAGTNSGHFVIYIQNKKLSFLYRDTQNSVTRTLTSEKELVNGIEYELTFVKRWAQPGTVLYINGAEEQFNYPGFPAANLLGDAVTIGAQLFSGYPSSFFNGTIDQITVWNRALQPSEIQNYCNETHQFSNNFATFEVDGCYLGKVKSIVYSGAEQLTEPYSLSSFYFADGKIAYPSRIESLGNNLYNINYLGTDNEITIRIEPRQNYFVFEIEDSSIPDDFVMVDLFHFQTVHAPQSAEEISWAVNAAENEFFPNALPLNINTTCGPYPDPGYSLFGYNRYRCAARKQISVTGANGIFQTAPKSAYFSTMRNIVSENNLTNITLGDGKWFRESEKLKEPYLFFSLTSSNKDALLNYASRGKFRQILLGTPTHFGTYLRPTTGTFQNLGELYSALNEFQNNGIKVGIHTFLNNVDRFDGLIDFAAPQQPLSDSLFVVEIANLSSDLSASDTVINLDNVLDSNPLFRYYYLGENQYGSTGTVFLVDDELILCGGYSGSSLTGCERPNLFVTTVTAHNTGAKVYHVPRATFSTLYINPNNNVLVESSTDSFASFMRDSNASFLYVDETILPPIYGIDDGESSLLIRHKYGLIPYLEKLDKIPLMQFGMNSPTYGWLYEARAATNDGVVFKSKEFTKLKADGVAADSPYDKYVYEFGWWKINGAAFSSARDFDATTKDDVHYVMAKALANDAAIGIQLSSFYESHKEINDTLNLIGLYNNLIDQSSATVPQQIKNYLKNSGNEAELKNISGYQLVEKKSGRNYAVWNSTASADFSFTNPFASQKLKIAMRPRFDYYPFGDAQHLTITDFSNAATFSVRTSGSDVLCTISNEGIVTVTNSGDAVGGCRINIPLSGVIDLSNKRGVGIIINGSSRGELVVVRLSVNDFEFRDFKFVVDFNGQKNITLGDATGDNEDIVNGQKTDWDGDAAKGRHWDFHYEITNGAAIYINNILPGATSTLQLFSLKALKEKPGQLVNPRISVSGQSVTFPITLRAADGVGYLLEYDGANRAYKVYNSNFGLLSQGNITTDNILIGSGANQISLTSDVSNSDYGSRAEIIANVYDDSDSDGIPTNGDYLSSHNWCGSGENFCDDNCQNVSNPSQSDDDGDGAGNACDVAPDDPDVGGPGDGGGGGGESDINQTHRACVNNTCRIVSGIGINSCSPVNSSCNTTIVNCVEQWVCAEWTECINGTKTQACTDLNSCGTFARRPALQQSCESAESSDEDAGILAGFADNKVTLILIIEFLAVAAVVVIIIFDAISRRKKADINDFRKYQHR